MRSGAANPRRVVVYCVFHCDTANGSSPRVDMSAAVRCTNRRCILFIIVSFQHFTDDQINANMMHTPEVASLFATVLSRHVFRGTLCTLPDGAQKLTRAI